MDLNFEALIRPYIENGRSLEGQVRWLRKKGIHPHAVEQAIQEVYTGMQLGKVYQDGNDLDYALLHRGIELMDDETQLILQRIGQMKIPGGRVKKAWAALKGKI
jgi:hypothetical protein